MLTPPDFERDIFFIADICTRLHVQVTFIGVAEGALPLLKFIQFSYTYTFLKMKLFIAYIFLKVAFFNRVAKNSKKWTFLIA